MRPVVFGVDHDYICPICGEKSAVWEQGVFQPCWTCQSEGWLLLKGKEIYKRHCINWLLGTNFDSSTCLPAHAIISLPTENGLHVDHDYPCPVCLKNPAEVDQNNLQPCIECRSKGWLVVRVEVGYKRHCINWLLGTNFDSIASLKKTAAYYYP